MTDNLEVLARRRLALVEQRDSISEQIKAIDAAIVNRIEVGATVEVDGHPVFRVSTRRTFDVDRARELLPDTVIEAATVPVLDAKLLRSLMPPALVDAAMVEGNPFLTAVR
jgi:hypothetical protein